MMAFLYIKKWHRKNGVFIYKWHRKNGVFRTDDPNVADLPRYLLGEYIGV
jgi:hypothetical protein|eukprot:COSAG06_NODE_215_length_20124_cov_3.931735_8_plen_50_part_00